MCLNIETTIKTIIYSAYEVNKILQFGFLENVYKQAISVELTSRKIRNEMERHIHVYYKGQQIGFYKADILVEDAIIIECKCVSSINLAHIRQTKNYLTATGLQHALIINFNKQGVTVKRVYGTD